MTCGKIPLLIFFFFNYNLITWAAVTPETSMTDPPLSTCLGKLTSFKRSVSISFIGHCTNCFPELSSQILIGIACKMCHRDNLFKFFFVF